MDKIAEDDLMRRWVKFLSQLAFHRYGIHPDKIIGVDRNVAVIYNDEGFTQEIPLAAPLRSYMPVDTIPIHACMIQVGIDEPITFVYNDRTLSSWMN